jgi:AcrR family transcriptional regulator
MAISTRISVRRNSSGPLHDHPVVRGQGTRTHILDAAEALFAAHGYDAVSIRNITSRAGVRLALATYHFNSKERLFEAIIARRAEVLRERRMAALNAVLEQGGATVEKILEAFIKPYLDLRISRDTGWQNYSLLIAQLAQLNRWLPLVDKYFNPTARCFQDALCTALPELPKEVVSRCFVFSIQLMVSELAGNERINTLSGRALKGSDVKAVYSDLIPFLVGGFEAFLHINKAGRSRRPGAPGSLGVKRNRSPPFRALKGGAFKPL